MSMLIQSTRFLKNSYIQEHSSEDEQIDKNSKRVIPYPMFYMLPNDDYPQLQRKYLIDKLQILTALHRKEENNLLSGKIGWNILYSYFFQKLFLVSKSLREKNKYLNLKEVEIRIRKQIGKIGKRKIINDEEEDEDKKEPYFDLFEKIQYNPPISSLFSHNFIKDPSNLLLGKNEENSMMTQILNTFVNYKKKEMKIPFINKKNFFLQKKEEIESKKNKKDKLRRKSRIELEKFNILQPKKESRLLDDVDLHLEKIIQKNDEQKIILRQEVIPKGAKKIVKKFVNDFPSLNQIEVEDELNYIQNDQKVYDIEMKNTKMFENKLLDSKRYLFDFPYLKDMMIKEKKAASFNFKNEMDTILKQIDQAIEGAISIDKEENSVIEEK